MCRKQFDTPECCATMALEGGVYWILKGRDIDIERDGWHINVNHSYPDPGWSLVTHCPYCGKKLPE